MLGPVLRAVAAASFAFTLSVPLAAQCGFQWQPGAPASGPDGSVRATLVRPNGDVIAAGVFAIADGSAVANIARWDGTTWQPLGGGTNGPVAALATMTNGDLVVAGSFTAAGGVPASGLARWNGAAWSTFGGGPGSSGFVTALLPLPNDQLLIGGVFFQTAPGQERVALWNGSAWTSLGTGVPAYSVNALARLPNGDLLVGGDLASGTLRYPLRRWNGFVWQDVPGFTTFAPISVIHRLAPLPNGDVLITGNLDVNGVDGGLALLTGTGIQLVPAPAPAIAHQAPVLVAGNGDVWFGGNSTPGPSLRRWDGTNWTVVAGAPATVEALAEDAAGRIVAGGTSPTQPSARSVSRFDGASWDDLGAPLPPVVYATLLLPDGDLVVGGEFTSLSGVAANRLARWNGIAWSPLGLGVDGTVRALALAPNGDVIVGGDFLHAAGAPAQRIARWNGQAWASVGGGLATAPLHLAASPTGAILAAALDHVELFDGLSWSVVPLPGPGSALGIAALPDGSFVLSGAFQGLAAAPLTGLLRRAGGAWSPVAGAPALLQELLPLRDGSFVARGSAGLWRWDGTTWQTLPTVPNHATRVAVLADESLVACVRRPGAPLTSDLWRLTGGAWQVVAPIQGSAEVAGAAGHGDLFVSGPRVKGAGGQLAFGFAHAAPSCRASAVPVGAGCTGGAGPVTLAAGSGPWAGGVFTATANGMTANSLALQLIGLQPAALPLPAGAPGCSLLVQPLLADVFVPSGGNATTAFVVPASPGLAGLSFRLQVVGIELGATGIVRLTSSNAVDATIGVL